MYCTQDDSVKTVGSNTDAGMQSPRNLLTTTICDELRLATNFRNKVIGIALKDRGSILPAGHTAKGNGSCAYWYDSKTGNWITSTYYTSKLPDWVQKFNAQRSVDKYYKLGWNTLYPLSTYSQSTADENNYENKPFGAGAKGFPYDLNKFVGTGYNILSVTPFGNSLTAEFAKAAVTNEQLGQDTITDFLTVSFSSPDYVGHSFGPNSVEEEDTYLRLDKELADLLDFFDSKIGKNLYTVFLSADHGAAHVPAFAKDHDIPAGSVNFETLTTDLNSLLKEKFHKENLVAYMENYQVFFDLPLIESSSLQLKDIKAEAIRFLASKPGIARAFDINDLATVPLNVKIKDMLVNGYLPARSGQIQLVLEPQWLENYSGGGTTHGVWNPYDAHIPLLWYGWGIKHGKTDRETYMTDIAATVAALLHIQMPNGCVGHVIEGKVK